MSETKLADQATIQLEEPKKSLAHSIPDGVVELFLLTKRPTSEVPDNWDKDAFIGIYLYGSMDNGITWNLLSGFTTHGGIFIDEKGKEESANTHSQLIDPESEFGKAKNRLVQVKFTSINGTPPELTYDLIAKLWQ